MKNQHHAIANPFEMNWKIESRSKEIEGIKEHQNEIFELKNKIVCMAKKFTG